MGVGHVPRKVINTCWFFYYSESLPRFCLTLRWCDVFFFLNTAAAAPSPASVTVSASLLVNSITFSRRFFCVRACIFRSGSGTSL